MVIAAVMIIPRKDREGAPEVLFAQEQANPQKPLQLNPADGLG